MRGSAIGFCFTLVGFLVSALPLRAADPDQQAEAIVRQAQKLDAAGKVDSAKSLLSATAQQYRDAIQKKPEDAGQWSALAHIQLRRKEFAEAEKSITEAVRLQPDSGTFHAIRGCVLVCSDQVPAAEAEFRRAVELEPKNIQIRIDSAAAYAYARRFVEAEAQARAALEIDAGNPQATTLYGMFQLQNEKHLEALQTLRAGVKAHPQDPDLRDALIVALHSLELFDEAYVHQRTFYELDRDNGDVLEGLIILGSQLKKSDDVAAQITQLYELHRQGKYTDDSFAREKFVVGSKTVAVTEFFDPSDKWPPKYMFHILDDRGEEESKLMLLTSRELHKFFKPKADDETKPVSVLVQVLGKSHKTYATASNPPTYEQTKQLVIEIVEGKRKPSTGAPADKVE